MDALLFMTDISERFGGGGTAYVNPAAVETCPGLAG